MSRRKHRRNPRPSDAAGSNPQQTALIATTEPLAAEAAQTADQAAVEHEPESESELDTLPRQPEAAPVIGILAAEPALLIPPSTPSTMTITVDEPTLGARLKRGREAKSWSREDMAQRLRLPVSRIQEIEQDRFDQLGVVVYARSYLLRFAKLVDVPEILVRKQFPEVEAPAVVSRAASEPQANRRVQKWGRLASMVGLTAVLALSVFSFSRWQMPTTVQVRSLESPELPAAPAEAPVATPASAPNPAPTFAASFEANQPAGDPTTAERRDPTMAVQPAAAQPMAVQPAAAQPAPETLMASMTPMPPSRPTLAPGDHEITLTATDDSWMEVVEVGGRRIDQGLLRAGDSRRYVTRVPVRVRIGNSGGVQLKADGSLIDLVPLARRNVANLELFGASEKPPTQVESDASVESL
ncbi:hypothetical protein C7S18_13690 [Ahniella affigens]|uniref:HTH cro/C1-type domain-containing protein n=1 Tax=Ahniella affigens TaxID=2021234 RepID=A0A2P1PTM7_9GAMM|nr:helix-turn-helix domain-containing protein [Ahniella affigens]AVP98180.1 hypothetical protein C7S18_13690 [Ahniella affigens]